MTKKIITPRTLKGFRDFLPAEKKKRDFVMEKIKQTFALFGFEPLETPTLEYSSLLKGKYGTEADKLIYSFIDRGGRDISLKYDQTVPTARVLAQYQNLLPKFFRRYQIQNVFRADKPQKGRFREFTQCDIDIFGATSDIGLADAEILACTYFVYKNLGFNNIVLKINDRSILVKAVSPFYTKEVSKTSIIQSIDKLGKINEDEVARELVSKGLTIPTAKAALESVKKAALSQSLKNIINLAINLGVDKNALKFDPFLARGLDYYTGMVFEVVSSDYPTGSLAGGGRYDNLFLQLAEIDVPAVGMAIGFDRTVEAADQLNFIPASTAQAQVLVAVFANFKPALAAAAALRQKNINTEVFPTLDKIDKQLKYADKKGIPYVIIIGPDEAAKNLVTLKNMTTGQQNTLPLDKAIAKLK
ncbi:histidine--tRNA ligase [Patescibacteria group bacterium]|nr:histidine--tRNA ligase [Patescibacteria group bacterium]MBU1499726.1 histidine--tRNA ligase [Patescibacteria group bacterium]